MQLLALKMERKLEPRMQEASRNQKDNEMYSPLESPKKGMQP